MFCKKICIIFALICCSISFSHAQWLDKDEYMQHFQDQFMYNFPKNLTNRSFMGQWCNAMLSNNIASSTDDIQGYMYGAAYKSPRQSLFLYTLCTPFVENISKKFPDKIGAAMLFDEKMYHKLIPHGTDTCDFFDKKNDLSSCDVLSIAHIMMLYVLNDIYNIRYGAVLGYISDNKVDIGYDIAQHFAYSTKVLKSERIMDLNKLLCSNANTPLFASSVSEQCGFPQTYQEILYNSERGKKFVEQTTFVNGLSLLQYDCNAGDGSAIVACGINNRVNSTPFVSFVSNEMMVLKLFLSSYTYLITSNRDFAVGSKQGISDKQYQIIANTRISQAESVFNFIKDISNNMTRVVIDFEGNYYVHLGYLMIREQGGNLLMREGSQFFDALNYWSANRINTVKKQ